MRRERKRENNKENTSHIHITRLHTLDSYATNTVKAHRLFYIFMHGILLSEYKELRTKKRKRRRRKESNNQELHLYCVDTVFDGDLSAHACLRIENIWICWCACAH